MLQESPGRRAPGMLREEVASGRPARRLARTVLSLAFAAWAGCASAPGEERDFGKRPDWSLAGPGGATVSAADFDGKVLLVDFWATWCPPCRREVAGFSRLLEKYHGQGLEVVGFSFDHDRDAHDRFVRANLLPYSSLFIDSGPGKAEVAKFEKLIGPVDGLPTILVIRRDGTVVYKHVGYAPPEELERVVRPLLANP